MISDNNALIFIFVSIVEFISAKKTLDNILFYQRAQFIEKTGLPYTINVKGNYCLCFDESHG